MAIVDAKSDVKNKKFENNLGIMNENNVITQVNIPTGTISLIGWTGQTFNYPNLIKA